LADPDGPNHVCKLKRALMDLNSQLIVGTLLLILLAFARAMLLGAFM